MTETTTDERTETEDTPGDEERTARDEEDEERTDADHVADVDDGSGCTEIWEHLSEQRRDEE